MTKTNIQGISQILPIGAYLRNGIFLTPKHKTTNNTHTQINKQHTHTYIVHTYISNTHTHTHTHAHIHTFQTHTHTHTHIHTFQTHTHAHTHISHTHTHTHTHLSIMQKKCFGGFVLFWRRRRYFSTIIFSMILFKKLTGIIEKIIVEKKIACGAKIKRTPKNTFFSQLQN